MTHYKHRKSHETQGRIGVQGKQHWIGSWEESVVTVALVTHQGLLNLSVPKFPHPQNQADHPDSTFLSSGILRACWVALKYHIISAGETEVMGAVSILKTQLIMPN